MQPPPPILRTDLFRPGQHIAVAVSGGADSVALLRRLLQEQRALGITLSVAHVNHGIRGVASAEDEAFVGALAAAHDLPFHLHRTNAPAAAQALHETLEEAARNLRYAWFRELLADGRADAVATAHTLDDQAETVLHKLVRGAWTEGLSGIHPVLKAGNKSILRPFLENSHATNEAWLQWLPQPWREDETNRDMVYTRNRIRGQLLPLLRTFNPRMAEQLARLASICADEEAYWQREVERLLPSLLLPGKPSRGGGRSISTHPEEETIAIEHARLRALQPAVARRVLRAAARRLGSRLNFEHTERLMALVQSESTRPASRAGKFDLPGGITVERTLREIRLSRAATHPLENAPAYVFRVPGDVQAPEFGLRLRVECVGPKYAEENAPEHAKEHAESQSFRATLRPWRAGDRVTLRHSRGPKKVSDVLDRLHITGKDRLGWPVVALEGDPLEGKELEGAIVWMRGVEVEAPQLRFTVEFLA